MIGIDFGFGAIENQLWQLLFAMVRIGAALIAAPLFGAVNVPFQARIILAGSIAILISAWFPQIAPPVGFTLASSVSVAGEILIGLALGFILQLAFAAPVIAAEIIGGGMGMGIAGSVDPSSGAHAPVFAQYFAVLLTLTFVALGGHTLFIELVIRSYQTFPPGQTWLGAERLAAIPAFADTMFRLALLIALPTTLILLATQFAAGVLSRSAPSLNLFSLGLPLGVLAGIAALILSAPIAKLQMEQVSEMGLSQLRDLLEK